MCSCFGKPPKTDKLWRLYKQGSERIEKEFDITKIIKTTRNLKTFMKARLINEKMTVELEHSSKNVIEIDETEEGSQSDCSEVYPTVVSAEQQREIEYT